MAEPEYPIIDSEYEIAPALEPDAFPGLEPLPEPEQLAAAPEQAGAAALAVAPPLAPVVPAPIRVGPFTFRRYPFQIRELPPGSRPYRLAKPFPLRDTGVHDSTGVRMARLGGRLYDHPVGQAQYGINLLESHRLTGTAAYLDRAKRQAQRLIDRRVRRGSGWFFPYPFRYALHRRYDIYAPPWFSMMAQGQALSLFVRLFQVTGEAKWRQAAAATFASYLLPPAARQPWGVYTVDGLLWLEEYPNPAAVRGDRTYNGHTFSAYGLWDYWVLTREERALHLLQGALTTTRDVYLQVRNRHWRGKYCLTHGADAGTYHTTHIGQHLMLHGITTQPVFAQSADLYYRDYPVHGIRGKIMFHPGTHTGHRFDGRGAVLARKTITLARRSNAPSSDRLKVLNQTGLWYRISAGSLAGYLLRETPGKSYQLGRYAALGYRVVRNGRVARAPIKVYRIDSAGGMTSEVANFAVGDRVTVDVRAMLNGVEHLRLAAGTYAGRWVGATMLTLT